MNKQTKRNFLAEQRKQLYDRQSEAVKKKLDRLKELDSKEYQVKIIKRKRIIPQVGDVFVVSPMENVYYCGVVINSGLEICDTYSSVVFILDKELDSMDVSVEELNFENLLIKPVIVDKGYWSRGYFYNIGKRIEIPDNLDYGFYDVWEDVFLDEYDRPIHKQPKFVGTSGIVTGTGVAYYINEALILKGRI